MVLFTNKSSFDEYMRGGYNKDFMPYLKEEAKMDNELYKMCDRLDRRAMRLAESETRQSIMRPAMWKKFFKSVNKVYVRIPHHQAMALDNFYREMESIAGPKPDVLRFTAFCTAKADMYLHSLLKE